MSRDLKRCVAAALAGLLVLLSGCSWITEFVIANTSRSQLSVSYLVRGKSCPDGNFIVVPARKAIADFEKDGANWQQLAPGDYTCHAGNFVVSTILPAGTALLVARVATYTGSDSYGNNESFDVLRLELKGVDGEISLNGLQVVKAFKFETRTRYLLNY